MRRSLRLTLAAAVVAVAALTLGAPSVWAQAAKFQFANSSVNNSGALVVSFEQRGLGEGNINYTLSADATALYACINRGGKNPEAANKQSFEGQVSGGASLESKNGRVTGSITAGPLLAPSFTCPSGQTRVLASVSYTNIVLTDTTNNKSISAADVSRTFIAV
jgi:hypothetical protein